jgi:TRAP-type transport system small permease protein
MMQKIEQRFFQGLELILAVLLAGMVVMVFANVMLRWFADSGIQLSEELSRYFFVWLTFIGAVVVMKERAHLGVDALVQKFGSTGRLICMIVSDLLVLFCCAVFFWGTWKQAPINYTTVAPVSGLNMLWVFGVGFFTSIGIGIIILARLVRALTGNLAADELDQFSGTSSLAVEDTLKGRLE